MIGQMTGEFDQSILERGGVAELADRKRLFARFKVIPQPNEAKSKEAQRPIYDDVEFVEVFIPGEREPSTFPSNEHYRAQYPEAYAKFKAGQTVVNSGTPLETLTWLQPGRVAELKGISIFTVEQLADIADSRIARLGMGGREEVRKAKVFLDAAASGAVVQKLADENEALKAQIAELRAEFELAKQTIGALRNGEEFEIKEIKKKGRPRKLPLTEEINE